VVSLLTQQQASICPTGELMPDCAISALARDAPCSAKGLLSNARLRPWSDSRALDWHPCAAVALRPAAALHGPGEPSPINRLHVPIGNAQSLTGDIRQECLPPRCEEPRHCRRPFLGVEPRPAFVVGDHAAVEAWGNPSVVGVERSPAPVSRALAFALNTFAVAHTDKAFFRLGADWPVMADFFPLICPPHRTLFRKPLI
jgi:hypothetical protein